MAGTNEEHRVDRQPVDERKKGRAMRRPALLFQDRCRIYYNTDNLGFAAAQNQAIALANGDWILTLNPDVLLMDEPFASVDAQTRMTLQEELTRIWQERRPTILFITHDVSESVFLADRVVVLSKGRVLEELPIPLERPRAWENLIEDDTFKALSAQVLQKVRSA